MKLGVVSAWRVAAALAVAATGCTGLRDDEPRMAADAAIDGGGRGQSKPNGDSGAVGSGGKSGTAVGAGTGAGADAGHDAGDDTERPDAGSGPDAPACTADECAACLAAPCLHGGTCAPISGGRKCTCIAPWFGDSCENNDDAALSALSVTAGALWPAFDPEVLEYTVDLGFADKTIAVIPTARVPDGAAIRVEGVNVASGASSAAKTLAINTSDGFSIMVASNTDARVTYEVTVRRSLVQRAYVKLNGDKTSSEMAIGTSLVMDSERIMFGMPRSKYIDIPNAGAVDTLLRAGATFQHGQWISPPMPQADAQFGTQIAFDGDYLAISAPMEDEGQDVDVGAVYVFERSAGRAFTNVARLSQPGPTLAERGFGAAIALAGDVLAVGGSSQRVYMYRRMNDSWQPQGSLEWPEDGFFGARVATDGTWLAVGGGGPDVQLYRYTPATTSPWQHQATLRPDTAAENNFGSGLAFHGDVLAVSSSYACFMGCNGLASLYTFARDGVVWNKVGRLEAQRPPEVPVNAAPGFYGVMLAFDGRTIVTSAVAEPLLAHGVYPSVPVSVTDGASAVGAGYVYDASGDDLELTAYLKASNGEGGDQFGSAVGVADGLIAIGAIGEDSSTGGVRSTAADDNAALEAGAIYVFGADCSLLPAGAIIPGC